MKELFMKSISLFVTITVFSFTLAFSQESETDTKTSNQALEPVIQEAPSTVPRQVTDETSDTLSPQIETSSEDSIITSDAQVKNKPQFKDKKPDTTIEIIDAAQKEETYPQEAFNDLETDKFTLDLILDISRGVSVTKLNAVKPDYISTKNKANFLFDIGIMIPFKKWFFTSINFRYVKLKFSLYNKTTSTMGDTVIVDTEESINFISAPIKFGMRYDKGPVVPYFYANIEPAYLTASGQFVITESNHIFADNTQVKTTITQDIETTDFRERHQIFIGGGAGFEISYGYGYIYIDAGCQYALFETDEPKDEKSRPLRSSSRIIYFPMSLGIRFYL